MLHRRRHRRSTHTSHLAQQLESLDDISAHRSVLQSHPELLERYEPRALQKVSQRRHVRSPLNKRTLQWADPRRRRNIRYEFERFCLDALRVAEVFDVSHGEGRRLLETR